MKAAPRQELQEVLEEWIILSLRLNHPLPVVDGIDLNLVSWEAVA